MKHDEQLTLFDGARNILKKKGIKPNISELIQVNKDVEEFEMREAELDKKYVSYKKEVKDLEQKYKNITEYLGYDKEQKSHEKERSSRDRKDKMRFAASAGQKCGDEWTRRGFTSDIVR